MQTAAVFQRNALTTQLISRLHRASSWQETTNIVESRRPHELRFNEPQRDGKRRTLGHVLSLNLRRRHLNESQRAKVAAKLATLEDGQRKVGQLADVPTQAEAAKLLNVGERTVRRAREVMENGTPELAAAVERGTVSVSAADVAVPSQSPANHGYTRFPRIRSGSGRQSNRVCAAYFCGKQLFTHKPARR